MKRYGAWILTLCLFACSTTRTPNPLANNPPTMTLAPAMTLTPTIDTIRFPPPTSTVFVTAISTLIPPSLTFTTEEQNIDQTEVPAFAPTHILPTLQAGKLIQLASIHMIDAQVGWGIYKESEKVQRPGSQGSPYPYGPEGYIVRTTDGGKTWQNVTPPNGAYSAGGFFCSRCEYGLGKQQCSLLYQSQYNAALAHYKWRQNLENQSAIFD